MRRFIAYSLLAATMVVAVGVSSSTVFTKMNYGREFNDSYEITFKVSALDSEGTLDENAADKVAEEMSRRLDSLDFEDYSVKVEKGEAKYGGTDGSVEKACQAVTVSFNCQEQFVNNICKYLTFSGTNFTLSPHSDDQPTYSTKAPLDYKNVRIEQYMDLVPIVVIPLTESGKEDVDKIVEIAEKEGETGETSSIMKRHDELSEGGGEEAPKNPDLYIWANITDADTISAANVNPESANKIIATFYKDTMWFIKDEASNKNDFKEHSCLKIICGTMNNDSYDFNRLSDANFMAKYYVGMFKASAYDYAITCDTANGVPGAGYDYVTNAIHLNASVENLLYYDNQVNLAASTTLIVTLVAIAVISVCLIFYYKLFSIGVISTTLSTLLLTYLAFMKMGALFGLPALIGAIVIAAGSLMAEIFYVNRVKEEVYKGRSLKKANQEASKKANLLTLDVAVVTAFAGLMFYVLGGVSLKPLGVVTFFGAIISLLMNLIVFKVLMYLLTNSTDLQNKQSLLSINKSKIPNLMMEQKATYVAPLEKTDFTKKSKLSGIILAALTLVSVVGIIVFGIKNGSPLNVENATRNTTTIYTTFREVENQPSEDMFRTEVLKGINFDSIEASTTTVYNFDGVDINVAEQVEAAKKTEYSYIVKIKLAQSNDEINAMKDQIKNNIIDAGYNDESLFDVEVTDVKELIYTPNQGLVALATGIAIAGAALYFMFRFKPSRGLAVMTVTVATTAITYGAVSLMRIGTTSITSLAMPLVAVVTLVASLFYLTAEKAMFKENMGEVTDEVRKEITKKALGKVALPTLLFSILVVYLSVNYFGFGLHATTVLFASLFAGELIGIASLFTVAGPLANVFANWFAKIRLPKFKFLEKKNNSSQVKQKTSEPEETTFIGIND